MADGGHSEAASRARDAAALLAGCPDGLFLLDATGALTWANPAAERLFGISLDEGRGRNALEFVHPDDVEIAILALASVQTKELGTLLELRIATATSWRLVEVRGAAFDDGVLMCVRDLTDRRRWEVAHDADARLRSLVQYAASITLLVSADGCVETSSGGLSRLIAIDQELVEGRPLAELVVADDRAELAAAIEAVRTSEGVAAHRTVAVRLRTGHGDHVPFSLTITNLLDDPTVGGLVVTGHDISDRVRAEDDLRRANSLLGATLEATADGILVVDLAGRIASFNARFAELWRLPADIVDARDTRRGLAFVLEQLEDPDAFVQKTHELYATPDAHSHDVLRLTDGRVFERDSLPQRIDGKVVGRVWSIRDVTEEHRLQSALAHQALHDRLTGLANQALFRDRVRHATSRRHREGTTAAVLFIDLDNFKDVNDSLGHAAGDALLVAVADRLVERLRDADTAARLGGDEFAIFIDDVVDEHDVVQIATRLIEALRTPVDIAGTEVDVAASIGIAFSTTGADADSMLRNADLAMYTAKAAGKGCVRVFAPSMHTAVLDRLDLEHTLRGAAGRGELVVQYQPIVELATGRVAAMEALVRWRHPQRGLLGPDAFIELAERNGLVAEVGDHVLRTACTEAAGWQSLAPAGDAPSVTVNLSPLQLLDRTLPTRVIELLDEVGLSPDRLVLEITEGALIREPAVVAKVLRELRDIGVRLAVDDFGTGYSSLAYLHQFPLHMLKIDRAFVQQLRASDDGLTRAIVQLAHTLELVPIAEGVESAAQVEWLRRLGCELAQGFHLGRPADAADARARVRAGSSRVSLAS